MASKTHSIHETFIEISYFPITSPSHIMCTSAFFLWLPNFFSLGRPLLVLSISVLIGIGPSCLRTAGLGSSCVASSSRFCPGCKTIILAAPGLSGLRWYYLSQLENNTYLRCLDPGCGLRSHLRLRSSHDRIWLVVLYECSSQIELIFKTASLLDLLDSK
jgi:hypothetical protein